MFKLKLLVVFIGLSLIFSGSAVGQSSNQQDFVISSFHADYYLSKNDSGVGAMDVTETITAKFPNYDQNHGILRALPLTYRGVDLGLKVTAVINQTNGSTAYSTYEQNGNLVLKIGEADKFVQSSQTYHIKYSLKNVITDFKDHQELFWNVNGTQWQQPTERVSATVNFAAEIEKSLDGSMVCLSGLSGAKETNCVINAETAPNGQKQVIVSTTQALPAGGNMSLVISFKSATFTIDKNAQLVASLKKYVPYVFGLIAPLVFICLVLIDWLKSGRDPKGRGIIVPQYVPLKSLNVLESQAVLNESVSQKAITAQIIELAIKKYLTIIEENKDSKLLGLTVNSKKDYSVRLEKDPSGLKSSETEIIKMLFGDSFSVGQTVKMSSLANKAYTSFNKIAKDVPTELFKQGYFRVNPANVSWSIIKNSFMACLILGIILLIFIFTDLIKWPEQAMPIVIVAAIAAIAANLLGQKILPSKTRQGVEAKEYLLGLEQYIKLAEKDRIKFLQSPEGAEKYGDITTGQAKVKLFEKLLPFAMIFGHEKDWISSFKDVYSQAPDWYQGNWTAFNSAVFAGSLANFGASTTTSFTAPSSSGGSGFGGSSGGGGGGGGGGGW